VWSDAEPVDEHADAAYIAAANPAAILALIRELRAAREVVEHLRFHADDGCFECHYARVAYHRAKEGA
jgi:hypothetical protein